MKEEEEKDFWLSIPLKKNSNLFAFDGVFVNSNLICSCSFYLFPYCLFAIFGNNNESKSRWKENISDLNRTWGLSKAYQEVRRVTWVENEIASS